MSSPSLEKSVEELKTHVVNTLETNGVLGQIRAQLRANVYKAIDCDDERINADGTGPGKLMKSPLGRLMAEIVAEFFVFYEFKHSLSVFVPESNLGRELRSRNEVAFDAGLVHLRPGASILEQLLQLAMSSDSKGGEGWHSSASSTTASSPPPQQQSSASTRAPTLDIRPNRSDCSSPPPGHTHSPAAAAAKGDRHAPATDAPTSATSSTAGAPAAAAASTAGAPTTAANAAVVDVGDDGPLPKSGATGSSTTADGASRDDGGTSKPSAKAEREHLPATAADPSNATNAPGGADTGEEVSPAELTGATTRDQLEDKKRFRQLDKRIARLMISGSNGGTSDQPGNSREEKDAAATEHASQEHQEASAPPGADAHGDTPADAPADAPADTSADAPADTSADAPADCSGSRSVSPAIEDGGDPSRSLPRSASDSRASSLHDSPLGSPVHSRSSGRSPAHSRSSRDRSISRSRSVTPPSRAASPAASSVSGGAREGANLSAGAEDAGKLEESGGSISLEESNGSGSGSIDLTKNRSQGGTSVLRRSPMTLSGGARAVGLGDQGDDGGEESEGEDIDGSSAGGSIEAYQESEASHSSRDRGF